MLRPLIAAASAAALILVAAPESRGAPARPSTTWRPAARGNYTPANRSWVNMIVIHKAEGSNASGWFANPAASGSAHYDVHYNGRIYQSVAEDDVAWHAGNYSINRRSIGIEHAGYSARNDVTTAEYRSSARLVAYLCARYRIPIDRRHIIAHAEVPHPRIPGRFGGSNAHWDPGSHWNWSYYLNLVRSYYGNGGPVPPPPAGTGTPTLRQGSQGADVVRLQDLLRQRGFDPGPSDGDFGPRTAAAVRGFQSARRLSVDGVVGPQTWGALTASSSPSSPPSTSTPSTGTPTLRLGARGGAVVRLQDALRARGHNPGPSDGQFGTRTLGAVRAFQTARGLVVDGVVGPQTWGALSAAAPAAAPTASAPSSGPTLRLGARGAQVVRLQNLLRARGHDPGPSDGHFGPRTLGAVRAFQTARGLVVDGVVGPQTWGALGG